MTVLLSFLKNPKVILFIGLFIAITSFYFYISSVISENQKLIENNKELKESLLNTESIIQETHENVKAITDVRERVNVKKVRSNETVRKLKSNIESVNLSSLAYNNPDSIEKVINNASKKKKECFENVTRNILVDCSNSLPIFSE